MGMQHSFDELQAFNYGQSAHGGRDMALRRAVRSAEILQVNPMSQTRVFNSVSVKRPVYCMSVCMCACARALLYMHTHS